MRIQRDNNWTQFGLRIPRLSEPSVRERRRPAATRAMSISDLSSNEWCIGDDLGKCFEGREPKEKGPKLTRIIAATPKRWSCWRTGPDGRVCICQSLWGHSGSCPDLPLATGCVSTPERHFLHGEPQHRQLFVDVHGQVKRAGRSVSNLNKIAPLDQRIALPDRCLHSVEADVRPPTRKPGFDPCRPSKQS